MKCTLTVVCNGVRVSVPIDCKAALVTMASAPIVTLTARQKNVKIRMQTEGWRIAESLLRIRQ